jgi:hypothetical protein
MSGLLLSDGGGTSGNLLHSHAAKAQLQWLECT